MPADTYRRIDKIGAAQGLEAKHGKLVGGIAPLSIAPTHHDRNRQAIGNRLVELQVKRLEQEQRLIRRQAAGSQVKGRVSRKRTGW